MESYVKSVNTDKRSKKRLKFTSSKQRAKRASADVYRSYKRKIGVTSAATREESVHNPQGTERAKKRHRSRHSALDDSNKSAVVKLSIKDEEEVAEDSEMELDVSSTFAEELDIALDRNASEIFSKFHREIWLLVRSLPEILHHKEKILDLLMSYMLSPASLPERPSDLKDGNSHTGRQTFVINHATTDIVHLLSVLARDLRHEIHVYLHDKILPRIIDDLLNPPPPPPDSGKQPIPLDVTIVEAAFRTLSYIFRYDSDVLKDELESMRKYYGPTLANRRELVRRLAAETLAPLIRKLKSQNARQRHLKRVLKALASTEGQPQTHQSKRTQSDAVDGISQLVFQIVRGVPGRLHSQGHQSLEFVLSYCVGKGSGSKKSGSSLIFSVASSFLNRLCKHMDDTSMTSVAEKTIALAKSSITDFSNEVTSAEGANFLPVMSSLKLIEQVSSVRSGSPLLGQEDQHLKDLFDSIQTLCELKVFSAVPSNLRCEVLCHLCPIWKVLESKPGAASWLVNCLEGFLSNPNMGPQNIESTQSLVGVISKDLLPQLTEQTVLNAAGRTVLGAAASVAKHDPISSLFITFSVASRGISSDSEVGEKDSGSLFFSNGGSWCSLSATEKQNLLSCCLISIKNEKCTKDLVAKLVVALRCSPFVTQLSCESETEAESKRNFKRLSQWILNILTFLDAESTKKKQAYETAKQELTIAKSIALEALATSSLDHFNLAENSSSLEKAILRAKPIAESLLSSESESVWAVRGVAAFTRVLSKFNGLLDNQLDQVFDALVPNLRSKSHSLRLHTLEILVSFPPKSFVTDHGDLDIDGDLDEDPSFQLLGDSGSKKGPTGPCDILQCMYRLESIPIKLSNDRAFVAMISKIEVMGRTGKLPVVYAEAAANHMLGTFYVKFAPIWPVATRCLSSLLKGHENTVWPSIESKLLDVMERPPSHEDAPGYSNLSSEIQSFKEHMEACLLWQESYGLNVSIFGQSAEVSLEDDKVARFYMTDEETVMESVWGVVEQGQQTLAKNSRVIVPAFIRFLHTQYFACHQNDPDARELNLHQHIDVNKCVTYEDIEKYVVNKRLLCFLKAFAAVDGPKQLVQHNLLERIHMSFLNHQDESVAQMAVACLLKYKPPYLVPYSSFFYSILKKGQLRDALLDFAEKVKAGDVAESHRESLLPLIARILFGRLSAKGKKSSKDSPAARRAAILSFISVVCKTEEELFSFVYLMTRQFVSRKEKLVALESSTKEERKKAIDSLLSIGPEDLASLSSSVIEGFLHLLETVVSQLGYRIVSFVPQFTSIVLALCSLAADGRSRDETGGVDADATPGNIDNLSGRYSSIRSMCYQRLSEMFGQFGSAMDFEPYAEALWTSVERSIALLPEMVIKTEKAPAILALLETMSTEWRLIEMIEKHDVAVQSVVKCIADTSFSSVMSSSLTFVENLLTNHNPDSSSSASHTGVRLIKKYIPLLMEQFTLRLKNGSVLDKNTTNRRINSKSGPTLRQTTWRRELEILCRVSELMSDEDGNLLKNKSSILANLVSLLLPYLEPDQMTSDDIKLNVVGILKSTIPQVEHSSMPEICASLSNILAPLKGRPGIKSLLVRHSVASLVDAIAKVDPQFSLVAKKLINLTAIHTKRIDELDFDVVIPELNTLSQPVPDNAWLSLCNGAGVKPVILNLLISTCFQFLHNEDGVILRLAFSALKTFLSIAVSQAEPTSEAEVWEKLVESSIVPLARAGLHSRDASVRRYYILLVKEIAKTFQNHESPNLCGDLHKLCDDENEDLDFFMNITHVQIHRRARGFQRLRKFLNDAVAETDESPVCLQSLSNVLLPIAMHPIFECKTTTEATFALEAIATVGSISRLLSWNKYNNMLWTMLSHFDRYPEQERYLVGAICAVIDGFRYDLVVSHDSTEQNGDREYSDGIKKSAVWCSLERRMIPKFEELLTKEVVDRRGRRIKTIRPTIVLALLKLYQKFPERFFESKLPHLLSVICDSLRSRDSNARDVARKTIAKMVVSMDLKYLADVIREVAITLTEGYKLHVRAAVVHTILQELSNSYKPTSAEDGSLPQYLDTCTAALMELVQEDLFGEAKERRESQDTNVRFVKEAGGSKSLDSVELICRMLHFRPLEAEKNSRSRSSIHCVVSPLLERLRLPDVDTTTIRKIRQVLTRVVVGITHNPSVRADQLFPFVFATVEPFIGAQAILAAQRNQDDDDDDDLDDAARPIQISGAKKIGEAKNSKDKTKKGKVVEWLPSTLKAMDSAKAAQQSKREDRKELRKVRDGASAPKLTGSSRHDTSNISSRHNLNDPASISAVVFGLNLLNSCLKKLDLDDSTLPSMMDPFVPLLTACVCSCRETDVALVGLKCLMSFLRFKLPSISSCSKSLGTKALDFLTSSGSSLNQNPDLTQACFRTLTYLIKSDGESDKTGSGKVDILVDGEHLLAKSSRMPLNAEQMKVLISTLQMSVAESDQHNPALGLIKAILSRRYTSPELYDLMETMLKLVVRSHTAALRQQSSTIFVRYLLDYPMGEERFEKHLKQAIANINYEFQDGRLSAINLTTSLIEKLPEELLSKHSQLLFLPLVLQMVNDDSKNCREAVIKCLEVLLNRSSTKVLQDIHGYMVRWSKQPGPLRLASLQVFGILADSRSDFIKQMSLFADWTQRLQANLHEPDQSEWDILYFSLACIEKLSKSFEEDLSRLEELWKGVVKCLVFSHPWVRLASCRVLYKFFASNRLHKVLNKNLGLLFEIIRNMCIQLNMSEEEFSDELSDCCIKLLTLALPVVNESPHLCFAKGEEQNGRNPISWLMQRLSQTAKAKGSKRRIAIFKAFAAFSTNHMEIVSPYLESMLEALHRSSIESSNVLENPALSAHKQQVVGSEGMVSESNVASEVLQLLEETAVSTDTFLKAMGAVKSKARDKKEQRKLGIKLEAANDPQAAAQRKIKKQEREKHRKKRRVNERKLERGAVKKRRNWG